MALNEWTIKCNDEGNANKRLFLLQTVQKSLSTWCVMSADPPDITFVDCFCEQAMDNTHAPAGIECASRTADEKRN